MTRSAFLLRLPAVLAAPSLLAACRAQDPSTAPTPAMGRGSAGAMAIPPPDTTIAPLTKPKAEWQRLLERDRFDVLFNHATEPPRSSPLNDEHRAGTFVCAACHLPLFRSAAKFDSGTGWPSFTDPIHGHIGTTEDTSLPFEVRTEYHCVRCTGHQGHVFSDGPRPTGLRYCNNGLALLFFPDGEALPALRT